MKLKTQNSLPKSGYRFILNNRREKFKIFVLICGLWTVACGLYGCEAFVRKFTRKPKELRKEEPIIQPEIYPDKSVAKDMLYKDYFVFWQTWADELQTHLNEKANLKKQKECAYEALDNLFKMQSLLSEEKAKAFEPLAGEFKTVKDIIFAGRLVSSDFDYLRLKVERIKSKVHRDFIFSRVQKDLR